MTIDIEKLAVECGAYIATEYQGETPFMTRGEMIFDAESLYNFAEAYAAKVLEDKEREIVALNNAVQDALLSSRECRRKLVERGIYIYDLREYLEKIEIEAYKDQSDLNTIRKVIEISKEALSKTPAQSLQSFENEVIEMCAEEVEERGSRFEAEVIRALKGKP